MKFTHDIIVGLEIHVELNTKTKIFCSCPTEGDETPNSRVCQVCLGMPGSKPVLNKKVVESAIKLCIALKSKIADELIFSRKSYFYPDLSKNYQISQYELPLGTGGRVILDDGKEIKLTRVHIEEDPASLVHPGGGMSKSNHVLIDYNRSGNPLVEIVTEPEMHSAAEARDFMKQLIKILEYLNIFNVNDGIIKADANVSIKESGYIRSEIKNITGFKEIERALNYEIKRQKEEVAKGNKLRLESREWDAEMGVTNFMRIKETESDYGYIIDPDLIITDVSEMVPVLAKEVPELAHEKAAKFKESINEEDAKILAAEKELAEMFEKVAKEIDPVLAAKWMRKELPRVMNYNNKNWENLGIDEKHIISLLKLVETNKVTENVAKKILEKLMEKPFDVNEYVKKEGLVVVSDSSALEKYCDEVIAKNMQPAQDYKKGEEKALNFLMGQVMRLSRGAAKPDQIQKILKEKIDKMKF